MPQRLVTLMIAITIPFLARSVSAQDTPRVGIAMGLPASVGIIWQVTDGVALRPEINLARTSNDVTETISVSLGPTTSTNTQTITNDNSQVGIGLSALFYVFRDDKLRTYVSPRWVYTRTATSASAGTMGVAAGSTTGNANALSGSFGAQYALARRFGVFGEVGLGYSRSVASPTGSATLVTDSTGWNLTTRSAGGVIVFF